MTPDICRILVDNFDDLSVWRFTESEFRKFKQVAVLGIRKPRGTELQDTLWLEELASAPMSIRSLAEMPEERYALPDHPIEVNTFKGERFNQKELEQQLRRCNSFAQMMARSELDSGVKRPLLPLSISQIGLIGGSGMINGLIACDTPHIIKGRIVKVIRTESEEKFSAQGNHIGSEVKETITNKMIFNVLTPNGFTYGRGEKYSLELGSDLSRALTSELAMLAAPETLPMFLRKYQRRQIKQYRRREPVYKGAGDIICCLDESSSTAGECAAWGKAVAMTLLEIAESEGRRFALIHFSDFGTIKTDLFFPKQTTVEDRLRAAETFLDGGTDFCAPLNEALRLMEEKDFENADIVFITDGECVLPPEFISRLQEEQVRRRFTITGILLDQGYAGMDFSLRAFCQSIYRTSELTGEAIVYEMVNDLIQI